MPQLKSVITILSIISLVSGLSVGVISIWAFNQKYQSPENLHPKANEASKGNETTQKIWEQMKSDWRRTQQMNLAVISIGFFAGLIQFVVAVILIYGFEQASTKAIAGRYILSIIAILIVLLICVITTIASDPINPSSLPVDLKNALGLETGYPLLEQLGYGIRAYDLWIIMDLIYILTSCIIASIFLNCENPDKHIIKSLEIVVS